MYAAPCPTFVAIRLPPLHHLPGHFGSAAFGRGGQFGVHPERQFQLLVHLGPPVGFDLAHEQVVDEVEEPARRNPGQPVAALRGLALRGVRLRGVEAGEGEAGEESEDFPLDGSVVASVERPEEEADDRFVGRAHSAS